MSEEGWGQYRRQHDRGHIERACTFTRPVIRDPKVINHLSPPSDGSEFVPGTRVQSIRTYQCGTVVSIDKLAVRDSEPFKDVVTVLVDDLYEVWGFHRSNLVKIPKLSDLPH